MKGTRMNQENSIWTNQETLNKNHPVITSRLGMLGMFCATSSPGMGTALMLLGKNVGGGEGDL